MKKSIHLVLLAFVFVTVAAPVSAMHHGESAADKDGMKMDKKMDMEHDSMEGMTDQMIMLGKATDNGVTAKAHIMDIAAKMAEAGKTETHHIMTAFEDATGAQLQPKVIAVKVVSPSGVKSKPTKMMGMDGLYGANVTLTEKGAYTFDVATKMTDGAKHRYQFTYTVE